MTKTLSGTSLALVVVALLLMVPHAAPVTMPNVGDVLPRADEHVVKHSADAVTREEIQEALKRGGCTRLEKYLSRARNTLLVLCELSWTSLWGGMITGATTHIELTTYAAARVYWDGIILRDGYTVVP